MDKSSDEYFHLMNSFWKYEWKTPSLLKMEVLSDMSSSDIMWIVFDKKKELDLLWEKELLPLERALSFEYIQCIEKTIRILEWEVRKRNSWVSTKDEIDIEALKNSTSILDVIQSCIPLQNYRPRMNIRCPFKDHQKDRTPSFAIFPSSNTCWCFGCSKWWSPIDFYIHHYWVSLWEAIKMLKEFNKL
jgi:hypothetical protein